MRRRALSRATRFATGEEGHSLVEYGLLLLLVAAAILAAIGLFGSSLGSVFAGAASSI
jgi:Flp pilus assembly pilin Flp